MAIGFWRGKGLLICVALACAFANGANAEESDLSNVLRIYVPLLDDTYVDLVRDLDRSNLYTIRVVFEEKFSIKVRQNPERTLPFTQVVSMPFSDKVELLWIPQTGERLVGPLGKDKEVRDIPGAINHDQTIPFLVRFEGSSEEVLMVFNPRHKEHVLSFLKLEDPRIRDPLFARLKRGEVTGQELRNLLPLVSSYGLARPSSDDVASVYFKENFERDFERETRRSELVLKIDSLKARLKNEVVTADELRGVFSQLESVFPVDYDFTSAEELTGFRRRFEADFRMIRNMSFENLVRYVQIAESRLILLIDGLDRVHEHNAVDADKLLAMAFGVSTESRLFPLALEFSKAKHEQGSFDDKKFRDTLRVLESSPEFETRLMAAELLHGTGPDESFGVSLDFIRDLHRRSRETQGHRPDDVPESLWARCQLLIKKI